MRSGSVLRWRGNGAGGMSAPTGCGRRSRLRIKRERFALSIRTLRESDHSLHAHGEIDIAIGLPVRSNGCDPVLLVLFNRVGFSIGLLLVGIDLICIGALQA